MLQSYTSCSNEILPNYLYVEFEKSKQKKKSEQKNKLLVARREEGGGIGEREEGEYSQK